MKEPQSEARYELVVCRSRFIGYGCRIDCAEAARNLVRRERELHPGCTHVVFAYRHGASGDLFGMSDDREPKGTAGKPILDLLKGEGVTNVLVAVTRYFGGTKLGTGGLVKAYTATARGVVDKLALADYVEMAQFTLHAAYDLYERASRFVVETGGRIDDVAFGERVTMIGRVPAQRWSDLHELLLGLSSGRFGLESS